MRRASPTRTGISLKKPRTPCRRPRRRSCVVAGPDSVSVMLVALLLDARGTSDPVPKVVELAPPDVAARDDVDRRHGGRVQRERPLDADAERDLPDGERLARPA